MDELTDILYWQKRQSDLKPVNISELEKPEWLRILLQYLKKYEGGSFLEIGCSPGYVSALICSNIKFIPFGLDFSPMSHLYIETMRKNGFSNATLFNCDIRNFKTDKKFDVVGSVGLIEHFKDPLEILLRHYLLTKKGGIIFCVVPNFRYLQWVYHFIFDRKDLLYHNLEAMNLDIFREFSKRMNLEILYLNYCGKLRFWGINLEGKKVIVYARRLISRIVREFMNRFVSKVLPLDSKYYSPWLVYIAFKK